MAVTSCTMFTAEPFFVDTNPAALKPLRDAGLTDAQYKSCLEQAANDYAPWKTTRADFPFNPFRLTDGAKVEHDDAFTLQVMESCRKTLGARCVFDNHDLDTKLPKTLDATYAAMKRLGPEVEFQTGPETPDDLDGTIRLAVATGATSVELWQDYKGFPEVADADPQRWAKLLEDKSASKSMRREF